LTNIAAGDETQTELVVDLGVIPLFVEFLKSDVPRLGEQAIHGIGNIVPTSSDYIDQVIECGGFPLMVKLTENTQKKEEFKTGIWAICNICRRKPILPYEELSVAVKVLIKALDKNMEIDVIKDAIWAFSYVIGAENADVQDLIDNELAKKFVDMMELNQLGVLVPTIRSLGNMVNIANEAQLKEILKANPLPKLLEYLISPKAIVRKETCWLISNITCCGEEMIELIIGNSELMDRLITIAKNDSIEVI